MSLERRINLARWFLRFGLAFVFAYVATETHFNPNVFLGYIPPSVLDFVSASTFLFFFGIAEAILALWVISGLYGRAASIICFLLLAGITLPNLSTFSILFRNVAIASGALALFVLESEPLQNQAISTDSTGLPTGQVGSPSTAPTGSEPLKLA